MSDAQRRPELKLDPNKTPAFTAEDMTTYLQGAPQCSLGPTLSGLPPTVESVEFVGCKELTDRLNVSIGLADDAPVCHVVLRGPFHLTKISVPPGYRNPGPAICPTVEEIYNGRTGRLLVVAAGTFKPRPGY